MFYFISESFSKFFLWIAQKIVKCPFFTKLMFRRIFSLQNIWDKQQMFRFGILSHVGSTPLLRYGLKYLNFWRDCAVLTLPQRWRFLRDICVFSKLSQQHLNRLLFIFEQTLIYMEHCYCEQHAKRLESLSNQYVQVFPFYTKMCTFMNSF